MNIKLGDIFLVEFDPSTVTETRKRRPALVCSHDDMNENSNRVIVSPITSNLKKNYSFEYAIIGHSYINGKVMIDSSKQWKLGDKIMDVIIKFVLGLK